MKDKSEYIARRLGHARKNLSEIDTLVQYGFWNTALNRLYYACFYAVTALLYNYDLETKTHGGAHRMFNLHFVKTGVIDSQHGDLYTMLLDMRQDADYEDECEYDQQDVIPLVQSSIDFITAIEKVLAQ